jgi:predicted CxxxxCH...CXXCH cytochrome family protein
VGADGRIDLAAGLHIDGVVQTGARACTRCHGDATDATRPVAAPPGGVHGERSVSDRAVGAHQIHLTGTHLTLVPVDCTECHAVPTSMLDHPNPAYGPTNRVVDLSWGPLARAGGVVPTWNATALTCSNYCHGTTLTGGTNTAPRWTTVDGTQQRCTSCHGLPPPTAAHAQDPQTNPTPTDCKACHAGYTTTSVVKETHIDGLVNVNGPGGGGTCTSCHGSAGRSKSFLRPAPPNAVNGSSDTRSAGVGAHLAHLTGTHLSATPVACAECHPTQTRTDHAAQNGYVLQLRWGALASAEQSHPEYDERASTCSNTYCHGATLAGGRVQAPVWTQVTGNPAVGGSQVACGSCHGIPPPSPHVASVDCGTCHTGYTSSTVNLALHLDGLVQVSGGSCTSCHGDPSRTPAGIAAAPPVEARIAGGGTPPWAGDGASRAHLKHLVAGTLARAIACAECHTAPTGSPRGGTDTHGDGKATLTFGSLARTGGASPAFDAATASCRNTYCHGSTLPSAGTNTAPVWTRTDGTQVACGTCHATPPADPTHAAVTRGTSCGDCHSGYGGAVGGAAGSLTVNTALHVNGVVDATGGTCTSCHGTKGRRLVAGADPQAASAPPADARGFSGAGAHLAHLGKDTGAIGAPTACSECHAVPTAGPRGGGDTHGDGLATVAFGALARSDAASPTFDAATLRCSNTYCHGATLRGGTLTAPVWGGTSQAACGACHGLPPPSPHPAGTGCGTCHAGYTSSTVNVSTHVDGKVESSTLGCTSCHGDASRPSAIAPAPPAEAANPAGGTAPWAGDGASGAHLKHLVAGALGPAVACSECHTVPTKAPQGAGDPHGDGRVTIAFGTRARTGGSSPSFSATALTCSGTYCHGATLQGGTARTPVWTRTDGSQVTCGSCHANPPSDATHNGLAAGTACRGCHTGYGGTKGGAPGTFTVNAALHLNGAVDATGGTCTSCHGTQGRTVVTGGDSLTPSAPPANAGSFGTAGAHLAHLNKGSGAMGKHVACRECHAVPSSSPKGGSDLHGNGAANVSFGALSRTRGKNPSFSTGALTCSSTYCHLNGTPRWDGGAMSCTSCHANPPNDSCHSFRHEASNGRCNGCHRNTNATGTSITDITKHVDGVVQGLCTDCHRNEVCR